MSKGCDRAENLSLGAVKGPVEQEWKWEAA